MLGLSLVAAIGLAAQEGAEIRAFSSRNFSEIRAANAGHPLVVAFWSISCEPCKEELALLTELHRDFPKVRMVVVSTDSPEQRLAVQRFFAKYALGNVELWQYGDESEERIRYSVDPSWRGELPRSYFFEASGAVTKQSGAPEKSWARAWFKQANALER